MDKLFFIPTYIINIKDRKDRYIHIKNQFKDKEEFDVKIIEAVEHPVGRVGLWQSIVKIIKLAEENNDDVILICEDDHEFTSSYNYNKLVENIFAAHEKGVDFLNGGIGGFNMAIPVSNNFIWVDHFWCTQFVIVFRKFFNQILNEPFNENDTADHKFSTMTRNKLVLYPFISTQKDFGYSDVTPTNNVEQHLTNLFKGADARLKMIHNVYQFYQAPDLDLSKNN